MTAIILGIGVHFFLMLAVMTGMAKSRGPRTHRTIFLGIVFLLACISTVAWLSLIALGLVD